MHRTEFSRVTPTISPVRSISLRQRRVVVELGGQGSGQPGFATLARPTYPFTVEGDTLKLRAITR